MAKRGYIKPKDKAAMPFHTAGGPSLPDEELQRKRLINALLNTADLEQMHRRWTLGKRDDFGYDHEPVVPFDEFAEAARQKVKDDLELKGIIPGKPKGGIKIMKANHPELETYPTLFGGKEKSTAVPKKRIRLTKKVKDLMAKGTTDAEIDAIAAASFKPKIVLIKKAKHD